MKALQTYQSPALATLIYVDLDCCLPRNIVNAFKMCAQPRVLVYRVKSSSAKV